MIPQTPPSRHASLEAPNSPYEASVGRHSLTNSPGLCMSKEESDDIAKLYRRLREVTEIRSEC